MKRISLIAVVIILVSSCTEPLENHSSVKSQNVFKFKSIDHISSLTDKLSKMTEQELDFWENENSFVSYRSVLRQANNEWELISSPEEQSDFRKKYEDILTIKDSVLFPSISIPLYQSFVNREGLYETAGYINKVMGDYIVSVKKNDYSKLKFIKSIDFDQNGIVVEKSSIRISKFAGLDSNSDARAKSSCSAIMRADYYYNPSGCRDDRKVALNVKSYFVFSITYEGDWRQPWVLIEVSGTYRNGWCDWLSYRTQLEYRNVSFSIMNWATQNGAAVPTLYNKVLTDRSVDSEVKITWNEKIGDAVLNQLITPSPFISLHAEGKSRGVDNNWAVLDCN